jgi:hypothetical protein
MIFAPILAKPRLMGILLSLIGVSTVATVGFLPQDWPLLARVIAGIALGITTSLSVFMNKMLDDEDDLQDSSL